MLPHDSDDEIEAISNMPLIQRAQKFDKLRESLVEELTKARIDYG